MADARACFGRATTLVATWHCVLLGGALSPPSVHCPGIHIQTDKRIDTEVQPLAVAKVLKHIVDQETPDLVLVGKQSIDGDNNQTGTRVRACLLVLVLPAPLTPTRLL